MLILWDLLGQVGLTFFIFVYTFASVAKWCFLSTCTLDPFVELRDEKLREVSHVKNQAIGLLGSYKAVFLLGMGEASKRSWSI